MYPSPNTATPTFDQYGNQCGVNPLVGKGTAGSLAPGQSLFSVSGRISTLTSGAQTFPILTVPSNMILFITDMDLSTVGSAEIDTQVQSGAIPIVRASAFSTSPISQTYETQPMAIPGNVVSIVASQTTSAQNVDFYLAGYPQAIGQ